MTAEDKLRGQATQFEKQVIELAPGIWIAVGFAASNVHLIEGDGGAILIDTTESTQAATDIRAAFRERSNLPIKAIIYTHSHRDHISGATIFAEGGEPEIIARDNFSSDLVTDAATRPTPVKAILARTKRQFGIGLSFPDQHINIGIGPGDRPLRGLGAGYLPPTRRLTQHRETLEIAGRTLVLQAAPGETADHLIVWLEAERLLFCGDNFYHAFPNLYAIRGTVYRDFEAWAETLDALLEFDAEILAPGHTMPVFGAAAIRERLTDYRDAIRSVISQTVEGMSAELTPDELVEQVRLPPELAAKPWLQEFYGKVEWAVRAYFAGTMGWFDGRASHLFPLRPSDEAKRMATLAGSPGALLAAAQRALADGDHQWALTLADHLDHLDASAEAVREIKRTAYVELARVQINACARNYFLTAADEL
ncbi:MAG: alkyl/aryl-sulfatase [Pseudomonadota bacterium]